MAKMSRAYRVLSLTAIATFLVSLDLSIVVVARGEIEDTFGHDQANVLAWVFSAYSIAYAAGLLTAGRFADVFGRKRAFLRGLTIFSIGSVLCGFAPTAWMLVLARVIQAIGGAQLTPASIALVLPEFPVEKRTQAIAIWGSVGGLAAAIGPSAGGVLVDWWGWRSLFFINVPFCIFTVLMGRKILRESKDENAQRKVDYPSVLFGFTGVALVVLAISQSEEWGFVDIRSGVAFIIGLMLIGGFIRRCQTVDSPLLDLSLFKLPFVVASNLSGVLFSVGFIGMWLLNTTWLQEVWDYSVVRSGLATFPGPAMAAFVAPFAGKYATKLGHARVLFVGAVMLSFGTFMLSIFMTTEPNYVAHYLPWMVVTGIGVGLSISTLSSSATAFLPPSEFAMGSALNTTTRQIGTALGSAIALTVAAPAFKQVYELGIRAKDAATSGSPLVWAEETAKLDLSAYHTAWIINGVVYLAAGILMIVIYRKPTDAQMISAGAKVKFED